MQSDEWKRSENRRSHFAIFILHSSFSIPSYALFYAHTLPVYALYLDGQGKGTMMDSRLLWGTVEMLILEVVAQAPTYGYEIAQTVGEHSRGYFDLKEGSLYPALHRLEQQKLLTSFWDEVEGRRRKYYKPREGANVPRREKVRLESVFTRCQRRPRARTS